MATLLARSLFMVVIVAGRLGAEPVSASPQPRASASNAWPHTRSDLKPDPRVVFGRLGNDFRYMILPHANPAGRVSLHLLVEAGSYHENEDERGLAHFVEHMVFNGTRDFPGDETVKTLQRLGLSFGPDVNAYTTMRQTGYHLSNISATDPTALATGLKTLRNFADGALFAEAAVRKERKVILAEAASRQGAMSFASRRELEFLAPLGEVYAAEELTTVFSDTRIADRLDPMGSEKIIAKATAEQLRAFYDRWYRPERMILAVVGDIDPGAVETAVTAAFSSLRGRTSAPIEPPPSEPVVHGHNGPHLHMITQRGLPQTHVTLTSAVPRATDTSARRIAEISRRVALKLIAERLENARTDPGTGDWVASHAEPGWELPLLRIVLPTPLWKTAAVALVAEVRRAQEHGFSDEEIAGEIASVQRSLAADEREAPNRTSPDLAAALVYAASHGVVFTAPSADRQLLEPALATLTADACRDAARALWPDTRTSMIAWGPFGEKDTQDTEPIGAAWTAETDPTDQSAALVFPYTDFGPPGTLALRRYDEKHDCWFVQYANGVRLNFKPTSFEVGRLQLKVNFGHGNLSSDRPGMGTAIGPLFFGGMRRLPFDAIGPTFKKMGARIDSYVVGGADDNFYVKEDLDDENLLTGLQIITALLTDPAFDKSGEAQARAMFEPQFVAREQTADAAADYAWQRICLGGHVVTLLPTIAESRQLTFDELRDVIAPQLLTTPMEITVVGDMPAETVFALVGRTLGTLPPRPTADTVAPRRAFTPPALPRVETVRFKGDKSVGSVVLAWTQPNETGYHDDALAVVLAAIVGDRLRLTLRKEMGETYTPVASVWTPTALAPAPLSLRCRVETAPRHVKRVSKAMHQIADRIAREGVSADELARARLPLIQNVEASSKTNAWWLSELSQAQSKPQFFTGFDDQLAAYRAVTIDEINAFSRALFVEKNLCEVHALPE